MIRYVAVIDLGKTNSKLALVDTFNSRELQVLKQPAAVTSASLYPALDEQAIETFIIDSLQKIVSHHSIDAITVTTHGATVALINEAGQLAMPVLDYEFSGVDESLDEYIKLRPSFKDTGSPALPGGLNVGAQLYWQQTRYPEHFKNVSAILTWPQYWVYRLTGEQYNDLTSLGCHTDLYEPTRKRYSSLVNTRRWQSLMPPTRESGQPAGNLTADFSDRTGLTSQVPVFTGIHDSNASLIPHLISQAAPFSVVSTGTWFIAMAIGGKAVELDEHRDTLININARGESVPSARFMGGRERDLLNVTEPVSEEDVNNFLGRTDPAGMLMPSVVTGTGPYPAATKKWIVPTLEDTVCKADRACIVTLYLALMTNECLLLVGADGPIFIEGPLAGDLVYAQMLSIASKRKVLISRTKTGTSVGAAMLIGEPQKPPDYTEVSVGSALRVKLEKYASLWKQNLTEHT